MEEKEEKFDIIDEALEKLIDEFIDEDSDEDEFDDVGETLITVYSSLVDDGLLKEVPEEEDDDELKKGWIESSIPVLRDTMKGELDGDSDME